MKRKKNFTDHRKIFLEHFSGCRVSIFPPKRDGVLPRRHKRKIQRTHPNSIPCGQEIVRSRHSTGKSWSPPIFLGPAAGRNTAQLPSSCLPCSDAEWSSRTADGNRLPAPSPWSPPARDPALRRANTPLRIATPATPCCLRNDYIRRRAHASDLHSAPACVDPSKLATNPFFTILCLISEGSGVSLFASQEIGLQNNALPLGSLPCCRLRDGFKLSCLA